MSTGTEIEAKFLVRDLEHLAARLAKLNAQIIQPRTYERNIRFDLPDASLRLGKKVLRLRQDDQARLTFKGPGEIVDGIRARQEIEFVVEDFNKAYALFEALGYHVYLFYEKYRTTYTVGKTLIMLDEMPYGLFAEIEGENSATIKSMAEQLGLDMAKNTCESYQMLFERVRQNMGLTFKDLSFENFKGIEVMPSAFGEEYAD